MTRPEPFTIAEVLSVEGRIRARIVDQCWQRNLEPAWIILGQDEWLEFRQSRERIYDGAWMMASPLVEAPRFMGTPIATVSVEHWLEVLPKLPRGANHLARRG